MIEIIIKTKEKEEIISVNMKYIYLQKNGHTSISKQTCGAVCSVECHTGTFIDG